MLKCYLTQDKPRMKKQLIIATIFLMTRGIIMSQTTLTTFDKSYLNNKVKPTEDFFMYANGKWIEKNKIPDSESGWGSFNELEQNNKSKLTELLKSAQKNTGEKGSQNQLLGDYYQSYMDMATRNKLGAEVIKSDLDLVQSLTSTEELPTIIAVQHLNGINSLFNFGIDQDLKNVERNVAYLSQGGLGLPNCEYYLQENKKTILSAYKEYVKNVFIKFGYPLNEAAKNAEIIVKFETILAKSMLTPSELRIPETTYNPLSIVETFQLFGDFQIGNYFEKLELTELDTLIVGTTKFAETISNLYRQEELNTWKIYLSWNVMNSYIGHLGEDFVELKFDFYGRTLSGKKVRKPLNESCIDELTRIEIGELLGKAFVEKHFSKKAQDRVNVMVDNLLLVFKQRIGNLDWMSDVTKKQALIKLGSIGRKLGFPSKWEDYSSLNFSKGTYVENVREMNRYSMRKNLSQLNKPIDKEKWGMPAHMVNAYYHPLLNEIAFPAGIMQSPFFDENTEDAVNYGRIGMVIGHEFTHGFDDMGSKFAADGSFRNWWTEGDRKLFEEKTKMLGETFSGFCPIEGHCVNPDLTMGENIADLGGLTMAFYAYKLTDECRNGVKRDGFSPEQRFFISYAQLWKIKYTDAEMKNRIANDSHSPGMYRVNGPLMNCPEFFEAFNVKEGDKMRNVGKKLARIW
jgi:putative endopeptidase